MQISAYPLVLHPFFIALIKYKEPGNRLTIITRRKPGKEERMAEENSMTEEEAAKYREDSYNGTVSDVPVSKESEPVIEKPLETPVEDSVKEPDQQVDIEPEKQSDPEPDPWEGVPAAVKEKLEALDSRYSTIANLETRLKGAEQRVGSLQNKFQNPGKEKAKPEPAKLTEDQQKKVDAFKKEFPEFHEAIDIMTASNAGQSKQIDVSPLENQINELKQELAISKGETTENIERMQLSWKHPNFQDTVASKDYQKWLIDQPPEIQHLTTSPHAADAIKVLDSYSAFKKPATEPVPKKTAAEITAERKAKLENSAQVTNGRKATIPKSEADMTEAEIREKIASEVW